MTRSRLGFLLLLILGIVGTGIGIVYTEYLIRAEFVKLQDLNAERRDLEVRWEQLQLEEAALTTHARIENKAREQLGMRLPRRQDMRVIRVE